MRKLLAAALLAAPVLHAQVSKTSANDALQARAEAPAMAAASKGSIRPVTSSVAFSGITAPVLAHTAKIEYDASTLPGIPIAGSTVVVNYLVDESGVPQNIRIEKSVNALMEQRIVAAVKQFRYVPGKLDGQNVAIPVSLNVVFNR